MAPDPVALDSVTSGRALAPLFVLAGAPGVGKTTLAPRLIHKAAGPVVVDMDELLENGALLGVPIAHPEAAPNWPAYNRMWRRILAIIRRAGHPVILLCPIPSPEEMAEGALWDEPVHRALLDCDDQLRLDRLRGRGWPQDWIDDALTDARQGRELIGTVFPTDTDDMDVVAERILVWVASH
jgi:hypothetical protein